MLVFRIELQRDLLAMVYDQGMMNVIYQNHGNFEDAVKAPLLSAMEASSVEKYGMWIQAQPVRANITYAQIERYSRSEQIKAPIARRRRVVSVQDPETGGQSDGDEQPVYQVSGEGSGRSITTDVVKALTPTLDGMREDITSMMKTGTEHTQAIDNLRKENNILRQGLTNRNLHGDSTFATSGGSNSDQLVAPVQVSTAARYGKKPMAIAAAMQAGGSSRPPSKRAEVEEVKRTIITLAALKHHSPIWHDLVVKLLAKLNRTMDDDCVVCDRGNGKFPPRRKHPTKECGALFTLTPEGQEWLANKVVELNKRGAGFSRAANTFGKTSAKIALANGYTEEELVASVCGVCAGADDEAAALDLYQSAIEANWAGELEEAVMALADA